MTDRQNHYLISRIIVWVTLWLMFLLFGVKVLTGWEMKSLSLLAESLHALIVCFSLLFSWLAIISSDRPTGREIYGHGKRETFLVFLLAIIVAFGCAGLLWLCALQLMAIARQADLPFPVRVTLPLLQLLGFLVVTTLGLGIFNRVQSRIRRYPMLRFNANQIFKETGLTALVIASLGGVWWGEPLFDVLMAMMLAILALDSFWQLISWHWPLLIEQTAIAPEVLEQLVKEVEGVAHCDNIRSRGLVGRFFYIDMHLILESGEKTLAPKVARQIEQAIRDRYGPVQITLAIENEKGKF